MEQMKLLLTADLHFRIDWFRWLIGQAPNYDLVCIVGDLLDMFEVKSTREQAREVSSLIRGLADIVSVAVCSGTTIMPVDSSRMIDRHCMSGSLIWARIQTSLPTGQPESWKTRS
jgi:Icc-related predicted phosphoesterase